MRKVFISHANNDSTYVEAFIELLESMHMSEDSIVCSSIPPYCIPLNHDMYGWILREFQTRDLYVIYMFSENYYASAACLNEMGAAWALKRGWTGILLPGFEFNQIRGCVDATQIGIKIDDPDYATLKYRLGELKDNLIREFGLPKMSDAIWERKRDTFLKRTRPVA